VRIKSQKLSRSRSSLSSMNKRVHPDKRQSWRDRFLEIARQAEGLATSVEASRRPSGLRPRLPLRAFAPARRVRPAGLIVQA
jgi:hypothetical protein